LWHFIIVTDRDVLEQLGAAIGEGVAARLAARAAATDSSSVAMTSGAKHLMEKLGEVPLLIVVAAEMNYPPGAPDERYVFSTTLPAAQNIILAARALGLGATFTTSHHFAGDAFRRLLGLPDDVQIGAVIPVGWPARAFGPVRRKPIDECIHRERW
jgi:nitroreductase